MKVVVAGASGLVGCELVGPLAQAGHTLLLIARDVGKVKAQFPAINVVSIETWHSWAEGFDIFLHLIDLGENFRGRSTLDYDDVAALTESFSASARRLGISRFIYFCKVDALLPGHHSKNDSIIEDRRESVRVHYGESAEIVYLGFLRGMNHPRRAFSSSTLSQGCVSPLSSLFATLVPTTSIDDVIGYVSSPRPEGKTTSHILTDQKTKNYGYRLWRVCVDALFIAAVFFFIPLLTFVWVAIVIEDGRPGFFLQKRVGRGKSVFSCVKLRTMRNGTASDGTHLVPQRAITRAGAPLRRFKIDELPQAWNILRREMSLLGPRPCLPNQHEVIAARDLLGIFDHRPGLTGWAQASGVDMSEPEKVARYDAEYLGLQSVWFDALVLRRTLFRA